LVEHYPEHGCNSNRQEASKRRKGAALEKGICEPLARVSFIVFLSFESADWPMSGANPQRTSWTSDQIGAAGVKWFRPFEAYIMPYTQVIVANGMVYVSTARGLYALDAQNGITQWVFPTEMPLGQGANG
jgi:outer membrane protein assembly factor BamB